MRGTFTVIPESRDGRVVGPTFTGNAVVIGRGAEAGLRNRDPNLSRRHCRFEARDDGVYVVDLESTGGIYTETRQRIQRPHRLANGERVVLLGDLYVRVVWE